MTTPTLPAEVRDTIANAIANAIDSNYALSAPCYDIARDRMAQDVCAALGPVWADAQKDSERLDWLEKRFECLEEWEAIAIKSPETVSLRAAIDAAMKEGK